MADAHGPRVSRPRNSGRLLFPGPDGRRSVGVSLRSTSGGGSAPDHGARRSQRAPYVARRDRRVRPAGSISSAGAQCVPRNPPAWDARPRSSGLDALTGIGEAGTQSRVLPLPVGETAFPQEIPTASVPCGRTPCTQGPLMPAGDVRLRRASSCPVGLPGRRRRLRADRDPVATVDRPPAPPGSSPSAARIRPDG
jgi:hypothetical protein